MKYGKYLLSPSSPVAELLTVEQFAERLQVSRTTIFGWLKKGVLKEGIHYLRIGRIIRLCWQAALSLTSPTMRKTTVDFTGTPPLATVSLPLPSLNSKAMSEHKEELPGSPPQLPPAPLKRKGRGKSVRSKSKPAINLDY